MPYSRSWAFNAGAPGGSGKLLVFHDGDVLVPEGYAAELWHRCQEGYEVVNLKRFIFYLSEAQSRKTVSERRLSLAQPPEVVMQNAEAGGSIALTRDAFHAIGGYDESFVGWGGEDSEFWERAQTRRVWPYGYLPFVHLWHSPQAEKLHGARVPAEHFRRRSELSPEARIAELTARDFGNPGKIDPPWIPAGRGSRSSAGGARDAN
jgi:GT2 family glycosyltransferase